MPAQLPKKLLKLALIGLFFLFFSGACATLEKWDKYIDNMGRPDPEMFQESPPAKKVPLPPTIKDFESGMPD